MITDPGPGGKKSTGIKEVFEVRGDVRDDLGMDRGGGPVVPGADDKYLKEGDKVFKTTNAVVLENLIGQVMVKLTEGSGKK